MIGVYMKSTELVLSGLLAAVVMVIEITAAYIGESMTAITVLSAVPIYIISRINIKYGILSYFCVGLLLLIINPHQMAFFICTNGIIGFSLGICKQRKPVFTVAVCSSILFIGINAALFLIGSSFVLYKKYYLLISCALFCVIYITFCNMCLTKIYNYIKRIFYNLF